MSKKYNIPKKVCRDCKKKYQPNSNRQVLCHKCSNRANAICEKCGKAFKPTGGTTGRFCSKECWYKTIGIPEYYRRPCDVCGIEFKPTRTRQKVCSRKCASQLHKRPLRICSVCGKEFDSRHYSETCSNACAGIRKRLERPTACARCGGEIPFSRFRQRKYCSAECRKTPLGEKRYTTLGYVLIRVGTQNPSANHRGWILEHRHVIESALGRQLEKRERIHHRNGDKMDNRLENLELWTLDKNHPGGVRVTDKIIDSVLSHPKIIALGNDIQETVKSVLSELLPERKIVV